MRTALRPLRLPAFPQLSSAYFVNELGNWLGEVALAILVFDQTGSATATAALFLAMQFVPAITTPPVVARLEAFRARRVLPALFLGEAIAFAGLALLAEEFLLPAVLLVAAVDGALAASSRTLTRSAAASMLRPRGLLREGNALLNLGFTAGAAAGPALAGLIVASAGVQVALLLDAVSFLIVAAVLASAPLPRVEVEPGSWPTRLRRGFTYVRKRLVLRRLLAAQALAFVAFTVVIPIEVIFAKQTLDAGDAGYGALLASWGIGMVAGSLLFATLRHVRLPVLLAASTLAIGIAYVATGLSPTIVWACAASAIGGTGNGIQWVAFVTVIQDLTRTALQARVIALLEALASAMPGFGFVIGGIVATLASPRAAYLTAGIAVVAALSGAVLWLRGAEWLRDVEPGAEPGMAASPLVDPHRPADQAPPIDERQG